MELQESLKRLLYYYTVILPGLLLNTSLSIKYDYNFNKSLDPCILVILMITVIKNLDN